EVIFTFGPWGFLFEPRGTPSIYPWQVAGRLVLAAGNALGIAFLAISAIRSTSLRWICAITMAILADSSILTCFLLFFVTMPSLPESRSKSAVGMVIAFAAG